LYFVLRGLPLGALSQSENPFPAVGAILWRCQLVTHRAYLPLAYTIMNIRISIPGHAQLFAESDSLGLLIDAVRS